MVDADYYQKHVSDLLDKNKITSVLFFSVFELYPIARFPIFTESPEM